MCQADRSSGIDVAECPLYCQCTCEHIQTSYLVLSADIQVVADINRDPVRPCQDLSLEFLVVSNRDHPREVQCVRSTNALTIRPQGQCIQLNFDYPLIVYLL